MAVDASWMFYLGKMVTWRGILLLVFTTCIAEGLQAASFYGESYIRVPFEDASSSTELQLHFKSQRSHGLLFLAAGSTDYLAVELKSGLIEVRLDLGSGEALVHSQPGVRLDDLQWHKLRLKRTNGNVELTVDEISRSATQTRGQFFELNIQYGLFLGGTGNFVEAFYGTFRNYRGCVKEVFFNGYDILHAAQQLKNPLNSFEVSWACDSVFDATSDKPISFLEDTSFVAFPRMHIRESGTFSCDVKTREETAILLYNSGVPPSQDYISVEIIKGKLKLSVNKGNGAAEMISKEGVSDGKWHQIDLYITTTSMELKLDGARQVTRFKLGDNKFINLGGHMFLGGLGFHARTHAVRQGLAILQGHKARTGSMRGCLRNVVVNSRAYGFREMQISRAIDPGCVWKYPCASEPCIEGALCQEAEKERYYCKCDQDMCTKPTAMSPGSSNLPPDKVLLIQAVRAMEGSDTPVTTNNIEVVFDYIEHRIRESAIIFHINVPPKHGTLEVHVGRRRNMAKFTLLDLLGRKVSYVHDGTDTIADDATIEMEILGQNSANIHSQLNERYAFVLPFTIKPRNDPPRIKLPPDGVLNVIRDSKLLVSHMVLDVDDPDTDPTQLIFSITFQREDSGYFERLDNPGERINTFTQDEINSGQIWFIHQGDATSFLRLKVSDGTSESESSDLRVTARQLQLKVGKNTGLVLPHGTSMLILKENLTTTTNVPIKYVELRYKLNQQPKFGEIQRRQHTDDKWVTANTFAQRHIDKGRLRYVHTDFSDLPPSDEFKFVVTAAEASTREASFKLTFVRVQVEVDMMSKLVLEHVPEVAISVNNLKILSNTPSLRPEDITIAVMKPPSHGHLYRKFGPSPRDHREELLVKGGMFTQEDIIMGNIVYKLKKMTYDKVEDFIDIEVSARGAEGNKFRLKIEYVPEESDMRFINNGLSGVIEGGQGVIGKDDLYVEMVDMEEFQYVVIEPVQHGVLHIMDPRSSAAIKANVTEFTNQDIRAGKLVYKHDDSENSRDSFMFTASPRLRGPAQGDKEITELTGTFEIRLTMRNDNPPKRFINKVFQVVNNEERIITIHDLAFVDPDSDFDSADLLYKRQRIPNGEIVDVKNGTVIQQFTQRDIIDGNILFIHSGVAYARSPIWVTDGQYYTTELFEIQASDPFVNVTNNSGLIVQQGQSVALSTHNLSIETNLNVGDDNVTFVLTEETSRGHLQINDRAVSKFTMADMIAGRVFYKHDGSSGLEDRFAFVVNAVKAQAKGIFTIGIFMESQQHPPRVVHNNVLEVEEGTAATIEHYMLHVSHPDSLPSDIVYTVTSPPAHGRLKVIRTSSTANTVPVTFTQDNIMKRKVRYVQTESNRTADKFIFDVTNGYKTLHKLEFFIEIVPKNLPVATTNFTLPEGGQARITDDIIHVKGKHFKNVAVVYSLSKPPASGWLELNARPLSRVSEFTSVQVAEGKISYVHDDSETTHDEVTLVARTAGVPNAKKSQPVTIYINVEPVNDQPPRVSVNKGLQVWRGSMKLITPDVLKAVDPDSPPALITFHVTNLSNGHIALVNNTFKRLTSFTQKLIDMHQVVFIHSGADVGSFHIEASDGLNRDVTWTFTVVAAPLFLTVSNNQQLEVYPNTIQPITWEYLQASTNDPNQTKPILFNFGAKPTHGRIVTLVNGRPMEVTSFSQEEVDKGSIHYQHTGHVSGWEQRDSVYFEITTLYAEPIRRERFDISISYTNVNTENRDQLIHIHELTVQEGQEGLIMPDHLDVTRFVRQLASIGRPVHVEYIITSLPRYGMLIIHGTEVGVNSRFTQSDINERLVRYKHDDSDTEADAFEMSISISSERSSGDASDSIKLPSYFNITVVPVNDQPFKLVTRNPSIQVIQGFRANITREQLLTEDQDTSAKEIVYSIITSPNNGRLVFKATPQRQIRRFTQDDLDNNRLVFYHDGSKDAGAFYFKVTDGAFPPYFKNFNIRVILLKVKLVTNQPIKIVQSESSVYLSRNNLDVETNGFRKDVMFTVITQPQFGKLYLGDERIASFSQSDVDEKLVLYIQTDMSAGRDRFHFNVGVGDSLIVNQHLNVSVTPLVNQNPFEAPAGSRVAITMFALDASRLATISGDNPHYDILEAPKYGKVAKKIRVRRDLDSNSFREVDAFTHEDILYGKIHYMANPMRITRERNDSFSYRLSAYNVQPAQGVFMVTLKPPEKNFQYYTTVIPRDPSHSGPNGGRSEQSDKPAGNGSVVDSEIVSPSISTDHILAIVFVCLLVFLIITGLVIFVLWKKRKEKKQENRLKQRPKPRPFISGPLQLDQPHVHIEPSQQHSSPASDDEHALMSDYGTSNIPVINISGDVDNTGSSPAMVSPPRSPDLSRTEVSSTVPSCKVTPLIENEDTSLVPKSPEGSAVSNNSADLFNFDWALMDPELLQHCRTTNPVLRKNQYWV